MKGKSWRLLFLILLLFLLVGVVRYRWFFGKKSFSEKNWEGEWEVSYFYENEPSLPYTGTLKISLKDSIAASLEIFAPKSSRSEQLELSSLSFREGGVKLLGYARHTGYKIKEGYLKETFELRLEEDGRFSGSGSCAAYCAEGTEGIGIRWEGTKSGITSTKNQ